MKTSIDMFIDEGRVSLGIANPTEKLMVRQPTHKEWSNYYLSKIKDAKSDVYTIVPNYWNIEGRRNAEYIAEWAMITAKASINHMITHILNNHCL